MRTLGLIGGMSWESSAEYYRLINEGVKKELGNMHSGKSIMYTVDFAEIEKLQHAGEWDKLTKELIEISKKLENFGADCILICTNTMHKMAGDIEKNISIPLLHIADAAAENIKELGLKKVGLLGTKFTMEQEFYTGRIKNEFGIEVITPNENDRAIVHNIIYNELVQGVIKESSKIKYLEIMDKLKENGAEGIVLACTEIPLIVKQEDYSLPLFDTTELHVKKGLKFALGE